MSSFDKASRGPAGSALLLWTVRGRHLASIGAVITILAVASDPFIQQGIKYPSCLQAPFDESASVAATNNYTLSGMHLAILSESLDLPMKAAIYGGVFNSSLPVTPTCGTGNCTFPIYRTVGVCSNCQDISSTLNVSCSNQTKEGQASSGCTWKVPDRLAQCSLNLTSPSQNTPLLAMCPGQNGNSSVTPQASFSGLGPASWSLSNTNIITFTQSLEYNQVHNFEFNGSSVDVMALQCTLDPCVRTYATNVTNNERLELLLSTDPMAAVSELPGQTFTATPMPCLINGRSYTAVDFLERNSTNLIPTQGLLPNNQTAYLPVDCFFTYADAEGVQDYLNTFMVGNVSTGESGQEIDNTEWLGLVYNSASATFDTVNATWATIAESMTTRIRQAGYPANSVRVQGITWVEETCVVVDWVWLAYPAILCGLNVIFLLATIVNSAMKHSQSSWKASPLALLFHGLDQDVKARQGNLDDLKDMEVLAKALKVRLVGGNFSGLSVVSTAQR